MAETVSSMLLRKDNPRSDSLTLTRLSANPETTPRREAHPIDGSSSLRHLAHIDEIRAAGRYGLEFPAASSGNTVYWDTSGRRARPRNAPGPSAVTATVGAR